jgi:hypothetical protein
MYFRRASLLAALLILLGLGLALGCLRGLLNREGMYDEESRAVMLFSQILGLLLGLALAAGGFVMLGWRPLP